MFQEGLCSAARVSDVKAYYCTTWVGLCYMPAVSVRITAEQKRRLAKQGDVSEVIRDAVRRYLKDEDAEAVFARLRAPQNENDVRTTPEELARMKGEDRGRDSR